jgi:L-fuculose-phosphate aldolase
MKPLLDDFAQLIGPTVKCAVFGASSAKVVKALGNKNAVLLKDNGAICVAGTKYDAEAIEIVMDKGCKTLVGANLYSGVKAINAIEANLMRIIYKMKYSKKAGK